MYRCAFSVAAAVLLHPARQGGHAGGGREGTGVRRVLCHARLVAREPEIDDQRREAQEDREHRRDQDRYRPAVVDGTRRRAQEAARGAPARHEHHDQSAPDGGASPAYPVRVAAPALLACSIGMSTRVLLIPPDGNGTNGSRASCWLSAHTRNV